MTDQNSVIRFQTSRARKLCITEKLAESKLFFRFVERAAFVQGEQSLRSGVQLCARNKPALDEVSFGDELKLDSLKLNGRRRFVYNGNVLNHAVIKMFFVVERNAIDGAGGRKPYLELSGRVLRARQERSEDDQQDKQLKLHAEQR